MSTFGDLPPEMRNKIYRLLFILGKPIVLGWPFKLTPAWTAGEKRIGPFHVPVPQVLQASSALLATRREWYREGASILYGENEFYAPSFKSVQLFSQLIGSYATACIQTLIIDFDGIDNSIDYWNNYARSLRLLLQFRSLRTIEIKMHKTVYFLPAIPPVLEVSTLVPPRVKGRSRHIPRATPNLPRTLLDHCLLPTTFDIFFEVLLTSLSLATPGPGHPLRIDRYTLAPNNNAGRRLSQIGRTYNLALVSSRPPLAAIITTYMHLRLEDYLEFFVYWIPQLCVFVYYAAGPVERLRTVSWRKVERQVRASPRKCDAKVKSQGPLIAFE
ncbi:hypothetical protein FKW77_007240 [Venturia effusa]|uniref:Uncharacterized protein n=1 Tax=Venturia effusa TaxID=50376 RepID=A0A517LN80_9PEZI|nr:hypothetical protein FKW77_007240 [Venturia effusa]